MLRERAGADGDGRRQGGDNAGGERKEEAVFLRPYGRQEGQNHLKVWTRLTTLIDEEMPKCIWEPLFALLPTVTDTEWDHLSQESLLSLPRRVSDSPSLSHCHGSSTMPRQHGFYPEMRLS